MEIIKERLEREFALSLIGTAPTVIYKVKDSKGVETSVDNPSCLPDHFETIAEPYVKVSIFVPQEFVGHMLELCQSKRGTQKEFNYVGKERIVIVYELPLNEILWDFYDSLKSLSKGYASTGITNSSATANQTWSSSIYCSMASQSTPFP